MSYRRLGLVPVLLLFTSASVRAGSRPGLNAEAGANLNGVFFPYDAGEVPPLERESKPTPESRRWRAIGAVTAGAGAFVGYMPFAFSESRICVSDTQRLVEWSAITAGSAYLGYWLGKKFDRR